MDVRLLDLPWLTEPPSDFRAQVRSIGAPTLESRALAARLATGRLNSTQLHALGNTVMRLASEDSEAVRLGVLSNSTAALLYPTIAASALRHGVWVRVIGTPFDQVATQALDRASEINRAECQFVLLLIDHRGLPLVATPGDEQRARSSVEAALQYIDSIRSALRAASNCTLIAQTVPQAPNSLFGSLERSVPGTMAWLIDQYNCQLRSCIESSPDLLLDAAALAENVGLAQWHDPTQWTLGKFPFAQAIVPLYSEWVSRLIAAARGKARKCLVLDLDNTLWGGVIGDDGLAGIVLGNGSPAGEAYLAIQQAALALRDRGILLAVSSKNDEQVARSAFRSHPEMLLKEDHISVFQANWHDKATNLQAIAKTLGFGTDALVLLDDNPFERAQVREALPTVAVPELPDDPAFYVEVLSAAGYFESVGFTSEDRDRAKQYQENAARSQALDGATDMASYLRSLAMRAICVPFDSISRGRITQLINKTNQFNLTTHRYTEPQVQALEESSSAFTLQVRLVDRFGDNGMIAVVICEVEGQDWLIDTWLMSCRVLNRGVEKATLNCIVEHAKTLGIRALIGQYVRTARNGMVADHYARLGFAPTYVRDDESRWILEVASYVPFEVPIDIVSAVAKSAADGEIAFA